MAGGYTTTGRDPIETLYLELDKMQRAIRELEMPTGSQTARATEKVNQLINSLPGLINGVLAVSVNTGTMNATGNVNAGGAVNATGAVSAGGAVSGSSGAFAGSLSSPGAASTDVSLIPGLRNVVYQLYSGANTGLYGFAPSTRDAKAGITEELPFTAAQVLKCVPRGYQYKGQIAIRDDPKIDGHDPQYVVPDELGLIAEELTENGLDCFVEYNEDGRPRSIDYVTFSAVALLSVVRDQQKQIDALTGRLSRIDNLVR